MSISKVIKKNSKNCYRDWFYAVILVQVSLWSSAEVYFPAEPCRHSLIRHKPRAKIIDLFQLYSYNKYINPCGPPTTRNIYD